MNKGSRCFDIKIFPGSSDVVNRVKGHLQMYLICCTNHIFSSNITPKFLAAVTGLLQTIYQCELRSAVV